MSKLGKRYRTFGTDWFYIIAIIIVISIAIRVGLSLGLKVEATIANSLTLFVLVSMIGFMMYYVKIHRPKFVLYDNAIKVFQNSQERTVEWSNITRMDGTRQTTIYFILVVKSGANHFYSESSKLFSVSFLTTRANNLVGFIISKMIEEQLPKYKELIDDGEVIEVGRSPSNLWTFWQKSEPFKISQAGIGNDKEWYSWDDVTHFTFTKDNDYTTVKILKAKSKSYQKLAIVPYNSQFLVMGIIDYILDTAYLSEAQDYLVDYKQQLTDGSKSIIKATILIIIILAVAIGFPSLYRVSQGLPIFTP